MSRQAHDLNLRTDGVACRVCKGTWKTLPRRDCAGIPVYRRQNQPLHLLCERDLRRMSRSRRGSADALLGTGSKQVPVVRLDRVAVDATATERVEIVLDWMAPRRCAGCLSFVADPPFNRCARPFCYVCEDLRRARLNPGVDHHQMSSIYGVIIRESDLHGSCLACLIEYEARQEIARAEARRTERQLRLVANLTPGTNYERPDLDYKTEVWCSEGAGEVAAKWLTDRRLAPVNEVSLDLVIAALRECRDAVLEKEHTGVDLWWASISNQPAIRWLLRWTHQDIAGSEHASDPLVQELRASLYRIAALCTWYYKADQADRDWLAGEIAWRGSNQLVPLLRVAR